MIYIILIDLLISISIKPDVLSLQKKEMKEKLYLQLLGWGSFCFVLLETGSPWSLSWLRTH